MKAGSVLQTKDYLSCAVLGPVSCGKTSLVSMIRNNISGTISKQRATMVTSVYREGREYDEALSNAQMKAVREADVNLREHQNKREIEEHLDNALHENTVLIPTIDMIERCPDVEVQLVDVPGLNDSDTKDLYFKHLEDIFDQLNIILLVFDINCAMNTDGEFQILKKTVELMKAFTDSTGHKQKLFVIANKCDDMTFNSTTDELEFVELENVELYEQLLLKVQSTIRESHQSLDWEMVRISAENSFIYNSFIQKGVKSLEKKYRDKLGVSEFGKKWNRLSPEAQTEKLQMMLTDDVDIGDSLRDSGYCLFKQQLNSYLTPSVQFGHILSNMTVSFGKLIREHLETPELLTGNIEYSDEDTKLHWGAYRKAINDRLLEGLKVVHGRYKTLLCVFSHTSQSPAYEQSPFSSAMQPILNKVRAIVIESSDPGPYCPTLVELTDILEDVRTCIRTFCGDVSQSHGDPASPKERDIFGFWVFEQELEDTLLCRYKGLCKNGSLTHQRLHTILSDEIPYINTSVVKDLSLVKVLFQNKSLITDYESGEAVIRYCEIYTSTGVITPTERNQYLADFIVARYKTILEAPAAPLPDWHQFYYAKTMVWDQVRLRQTYDDVRPQLFQLFSAHMFLCDKIMNRILLRTDASQVVGGKSVDIAVEEVCVQWHIDAMDDETDGLPTDPTAEGTGHRSKRHKKEHTDKISTQLATLTSIQQRLELAVSRN